MDKKEIVKILENEGLDLGEEAAVSITKTAFRIMRLIIPKLSNGGTLMILPFLDFAEPKILAMLDKIDGEDDAEY